MTPWYSTAAGYSYGGRIAALADAARENGLNF
ncbi:50S ribosomal protein L18 [Mycobacterium kansasii]